MNKSRLLSDLPKCSEDTRSQREEWQIFLVERPVPSGESARQHHIRYPTYEEHRPEECQKVQN